MIYVVFSVEPVWLQTDFLEKGGHLRDGIQHLQIAACTIYMWTIFFLSLS